MRIALVAFAVVLVAGGAFADEKPVSDVLPPATACLTSAELEAVIDTATAQASLAAARKSPFAVSAFAKIGALNAPPKPPATK